MVDWEKSFETLQSAVVAARGDSFDPGAPARAAQLDLNIDALTALRERWDRFRISDRYKDRDLLALLEREVDLLVDASRVDASRTAAVRLKKACSARRAREQEIFNQLLFNVDYTSQDRLFRRARRIPSVQDERVWSVALSGTADAGLYWLRRRLQHHMTLPASEDATPEDEPRELRWSFDTAALEQTLSGLFLQLAQDLQMTESSPTDDDVLLRICEEWQSRSVFFVFSRVDKVGPEGWEALLQRFWRPLVARARQKRRPQGTTEMLGFFLLDGGWQPPAATVATAPDQGFGPETPLLLPRLFPFSGEVRAQWDNGLRQWLSDHENDLPLDLRLSEDAAPALAEAESPRKTFMMLCKRCGYDFLSDLWPYDSTRL